MRSLILIAYFFSVMSSTGVTSVIGPFNDQSSCDKMRQWVVKGAGKPVVSACWWANAS